MSESVVKGLRQDIDEAITWWKRRSLNFPRSPVLLVNPDTLAALLDIAEAMAEHGPSLGEYYHCTYCGAETAVKTRYHAPDCPYRRARELCGMEQDGAE